MISHVNLHFFQCWLPSSTTYTALKLDSFKHNFAIPKKRWKSQINFARSINLNFPSCSFERRNYDEENWDWKWMLWSKRQKIVHYKSINELLNKFSCERKFLAGNKEKIRLRLCDFTFRELNLMGKLI